MSKQINVQVEFFNPTSPGSKDAARPARAAARPSSAAAAPSAAAAANLAPSADVAALFGPAELSALEVGARWKEGGEEGGKECHVW